MIIISDFVSNVREMLLGASIVAMINVLLYITLISIIIYFIRYYKCTNVVVIESPSVMLLMNDKVTHMQVLKSTIVHKFNSMPCTENFSHWSLRVILENDKSVILSSSRINNIHVFSEEDDKNPSYYIKGKPLRIVIDTSLADVIRYSHMVIKDTIYGYNLYNCQNIVYNIIDTFCKYSDTQKYIPLKNKKLVNALKDELFTFKDKYKDKHRK